MVSRDPGDPIAVRAGLDGWRRDTVERSTGHTVWFGGSTRAGRPAHDGVAWRAE